MPDGLPPALKEPGEPRLPFPCAVLFADRAVERGIPEIGRAHVCLPVPANHAPKPEGLLGAKPGDFFRERPPPDGGALHGPLPATVTMGCPMGSRQPSKSRESRAFRSPVRSCSPTGQLSVAYQ